MKFSRHAAYRVKSRNVFLEFFAVVAAVTLALLAIRDLSGLPSSLLVVAGLSVAVGLCHTALHAILGGYRSSWRFFSVQDAKAAVLASLASGLGIALLTLAFAAPILTTVGWIIVAIAAATGVLLPRLLARITHTHGMLGFGPVAAPNGLHRPSDGRQTLLMIGFGDHVANFIRTQTSASGEYHIAGVLHIQDHCEASSIRGVPVLGGLSSLRGTVERLTIAGERPDFLVLTRDEMATRSVGELLAITDKIGIPVAWLPRSDRIDSTAGQHLRPIELDDLLPRSANLFDSGACGQLMSDASVLVTGAGGSIGSELVRQIASLAPTNLILTDVSEHALYMIDQEIARSFPRLSITAKLLDVRDRDAVRRAMDAHQPDYVFHAAALKHVPIVEAQACEGVVTNVIGSANVAEASAEAGVKAMVLVSTDKAVNPANVMGATKRLAEAYCQAMDAAPAEIKRDTRYITVRFGNVLGSNGSVVPLFQKQLAKGGPLTVTHPDVERFFMTIPEASRLILQALLFGMDDADGDQGIFVLDMGEPVKIVDLARQVIRLSGLTPDRDVKIVYTGLRPGEKLYEELMHETENLLQTDHPSLMVARPRFVQIQTVRSQIEVIREAAVTGNADEVIRLLKFYIPEFETTAREAQVAAIRTGDSDRSTRPEAV